MESLVKNFNTNTDNNDEWLTPPEIIKALGEFDLDPCSPIDRPWDTAKKHFDINNDGLNQRWTGRIWLNPPYGKETFKWLYKLSEHKSGIALIFARTETKGFHRTIWRKAHSVFFFEGRLQFYNIDGSCINSNANAPSCLVSYSEQDSEAISKSNLAGKQIFLNG